MNVLGEPLITILDGSRKRLLTRAALVVAASALAASAIVWLGFSLIVAAARFDLFAVPAHLPVVEAIAIAFVIGALAAAVFFVSRRNTLEPGALALSIDRRADMRLAYATAFEATSQSPDNPIVHALIADTRARIAGIDAARLWPLAIPLVRNLILVGTIAAAAAAIVSLATVPSETVAPPPVASSADQTREEAQDLADRLNREAVLRQDPMLAAIARAIEERVIDAAPDAAPEALDEELDALIEQAHAAFGENAPSWLNERREAGRMPDGSNIATGVSGPQNPDAQQGTDEFAISLEDIASARRNQEIAALEADGRGPGEESAAMGEIRPGDGTPPGSGMTPERIEPQAMQFAGRESVGAAAESGRGAADQAGSGTQSLEGETMVDGAGADDTMALPQAAQETGRRIRITLPPSAAEQAAAEQASGAAGASAGGMTTQTVERPSLPAGSRAAVARYFERLAE